MQYEMKKKPFFFVFRTENHLEKENRFGMNYMKQARKQVKTEKKREKYG